MKIKKTIAMLLTLIMVLGMLPFAPLSASAEAEIVEYDIWIAGIRVTSETMANPPEIWHHTEYDPEKNELNLGNINIRSGNRDDYLYNGAVVYTTMEDLKICGTLWTRYGNGVCSTGNLTISSRLYVECSDTDSPVAFSADSLKLDYGVQLVVPEDGEFINGRIGTRNAPAKKIKFESGFPYEFDLWVKGTQITSSNYYNAITDLGVFFDKDTNTLYFADDLESSDTYNGSVIYSEMPELTVCFFNNAIIRTDAEYGIRTTGALRLKESVGVFANTCAIAAASLFFDDGVSDLYPAGCGFSNGAVRDAHGNPAPIVTSYEYTLYDLWLGETRVDTCNADNILKDGKARFVPETNTLTLSGTPDITGTHERSLIYADGFDLTIDGSGTVAGNADYALRCTGDLTICGECTFTANGAAILADGDLSIAENYVVLSPAGSVIENGTVMSSGSSATSVTVASGNRYGLWVGSIRATSANCNDILGDGSVSFDPGTNTLTLSGTPDISGTHEGSLIYADVSSLAISGEGTVAGDADYAIRCTGDLTIRATVTFTANVAAILAGGSLSLYEGSGIAFPVNGAISGGTVISSGAYAASVTVSVPDYYDLWLGSTQVTSHNKNDILNDGGKAVYDPDTNTLTLNEPVIEGVAVYRSETCKILCTTDRLTIVGTYDMKRENGCACGIRFTGDDLYFDGDFTIRGDEVGVRADGFVTVLSGKLVADGNVCGLVTDRKLKMDENAVFVKMYGSQYAYLFSMTYLFNPFDLSGTLAMTDPVRYSKKLVIEYGEIYCLISDEISGQYTTVAFASEAPELWVGRTKVTEENASDIFGDDSASFDPDTYTLVVHDFSDAKGFHTLANGTRTRIYAKNMDLTVRGSLHSSLTATTFHEYDVVVENGDLKLDGAFSFRGTEVGVIADKVTIKAGAFQAKGDADTAVRTSDLRIEKDVSTAGFQGGVTAVDTHAVLTYLDYFSCSGEIRNGKIYDGYGNVMSQATIRKASVFYDLWLGNRRVHEYNQDDIFGDGTARFNPATNTLTLSGADLSCWELGRNAAWIWYEGFDLTLRGSGKTPVNSLMEGGVHCPDSHSLTIEGYFEFIGAWAGISVHDLTVLSGGVSAVGGAYGVKLTGALSVSEDADYFYARATGTNFHVAVETKNGIQINGTRTQIIPENVELDCYSFRMADDPDAGFYQSFFLPGAETIDENLTHVFDLSMRVSELYYGTDYHLTVGDRRVTSINYGDIFGDGKASFNPENNTLTLNEPTIDGSNDATGADAKISAWDIDLTVQGSYHMNGGAYASGIYVKGGALSLDGDFRFLGNDTAIYAQNGITTNGTVAANVIPGSVFTTAALRTSGDVNVLGGSLYAGGGSIGISCPNGTLTIYAPDADSVILDGTAKALYAGGLVFDGNTDKKEFVLASPLGGLFVGKTIDLNSLGGYTVVPANHVEFLPTSTYGLWVNGKSVNPANCGNIFGDGNAVYDPDTRTLTLTDVEYGGAYIGAVIYAVGIDLTVTGRAKLTGAEYGIRVDGGSLTVNGVYADAGNASGIVGIISGGGVSTINGITVSGTVGGISAPDGAVTVTGKVSVYGETTGALSGNVMTLDGEITVSSASCGVNAARSLTASGNIDISGGSVAVRAQALRFMNDFGIVSPAVWSIDSVDSTVLDENGDTAKNVSIRYLVSYNLWLGSIEVTSLNCADIFGDGRASFDPDTNILTLCDPTIPGACSTSLGSASKILVSGRDLTIRGSYHMASDDECFFGLQVVDGTLNLDGFFTFRGTLYGVHSDRHVTVKGKLTAISASGVGISIIGDAADGLELLQSFVTETTVTAEGGDCAVLIGSNVLLPQNGLDLIEPADGRIDYYTKRILDANGERATRAVLLVDRLAGGKGTQAQPFLIMSGNDWNALADEIEKGLDTSGLYFILTANIDVTSMLGTNFYPFSGVIDGDGLGNGAYTLRLDLERDGETNVAPFRYIAGATIKNLDVTGSVKGVGASGLVGKIIGDGSLIENCDVCASVGTQSLCAAGLVLDGGSYTTSVASCTFSGSIYGFTVQTDHGSSGSSGTNNGFNVEITMDAAASLSSTLWGASSAGATVALTDCLDLTSFAFPVGRGDGSVTLTNVYYTAASKSESAQSVWNGAKRAYSVAGVDMTLIKSAGPGVPYGGLIYAAEGETVGFTTDIGDTALAVSDGTLTQNGESSALTMPATNVSVYRLTDMRYEIHYTENIPGGIVYPSRIRTYAGDTVRVYFMPRPGYVPDTVAVVDAQNTPIAVQTDENSNPCFTMPAGEVYLTAAFKMKYDYNADTGELRLVCGEFGETSASRWAEGDITRLMNVTSLTAEPGVRFVGSMAYLFNNFINCVSFDLHNVDVSGVTSVWRMFSNCRSMTSFNITGWDLSHVTDAHEMFNGCTALESFSLSLLSGVPLTDISGLLAGCTSLASVDLTALNPAALPNMNGIFAGCSNLREITLAPGMSVTPAMELNNNGCGWVADGTFVLLCDGDEHGAFTAPAAETTYKWATDVFGPKYTFDDTTGVLTLRWGKFNAFDDLWAPIRNRRSAVTSVTALSGVSLVGDCSGMFCYFGNCTSIDLSDADVSEMTSMNNMFGFCYKLTQLDISGWDTSQITDMSYAFQFCSLLSSVDVSFWNTRNVTNMTEMFSGCSSLTSIDLSRFDTASLTCAEAIFDMCTALVSANLSGWDLSGVASLAYMFSSCESLEIVNLKGWKTTNVTDMNGMFSECAALTVLDLSHFDVSSVTYFNDMFSGCSSLTSLNLAGWNTSAAIDMFNMFSGCSSLTSLSLSHFNTSNVELMHYMFSDCSSLISLNLSGFDTSKIKGMNGMFSGCSSLTLLDLSDFTLVPYYDDWEEEYCDPEVFDMFCGAAALKVLLLPANFAVTEEMCLPNGDVNDPGWVVQGDETLTVVSGAGEYAVIDPTAAATFVWKTLIALHPLSCDVNGDGEVNVLDVSALLDLLAENEENDLAYDLNGDGNVSVSDVSYLLDYLAAMH